MAQGKKTGYDRASFGMLLLDGCERRGWRIPDLVRNLGLDDGWRGSFYRATNLGAGKLGTLPDDKRRSV